MIIWKEGTVWSNRPDHHRGTTQHNITPHHRPPTRRASSQYRESREGAPSKDPTENHHSLPRPVHTALCVCVYHNAGPTLRRRGEGGRTTLNREHYFGCGAFLEVSVRGSHGIRRLPSPPLPLLPPNKFNSLAPFPWTYGPPRRMPRGE